jgi:hypothetical protein
MKNLNLLLVTIATAVAFSLNAGPMGTAFTYQGKLQDGGAPATGLYDFNFKLFTGPGNADPQVGSDFTTNNVPVTNGLCTVKLDFGNRFPGDARWLEIWANTNASAVVKLDPRQELTPTPYAIFAGTAATVTNQAITTLQLAPNAVTGPAIANGNVVRSLNGLTDALTLAPGPNISFGTVGNTITISGAAGGGPAWLLNGNGGTISTNHFLGTTDSQALEVRVNNSRAWRVEPSGISPNLIGGPPANGVAPGSYGATIGGGGAAGNGNRITAGNYGTIGGGVGNTNRSETGTIGGGWLNQVTNAAATVAGGQGNIASANWASVGGGNRNVASGQDSTVTGGSGNRAGAGQSTVGGGIGNDVSVSEATIAGGSGNRASAGQSTVGGGIGNQVAASEATIAGGSQNLIYSAASRATIGGGYLNTNEASQSTISGGANNWTKADNSVIGGGQYNLTTGGSTVIGGGENNGASGSLATVGGGIQNSASGNYSTVSGGNQNQATGQDAVVAGGSGNLANAGQSSVGGGIANSASGAASTIAGGQQNYADTVAASIGGGFKNRIADNADYSAMSGGYKNFIGRRVLDSIEFGFQTNTVYASVVDGGVNNTNIGHYSTVGGGQNNLIVGPANLVEASHAVIGGGLHNQLFAQNAGTIGGGRDNVVIAITLSFPADVQHHPTTTASLPSPQATWITLVMLRRPLLSCAASLLLPRMLTSTWTAIPAMRGS